MNATINNNLPTLYDATKLTYNEWMYDTPTFEITKNPLLREEERTNPDQIFNIAAGGVRSIEEYKACLLYTSPSPRDAHESRMPSSA